MRKALPKCNWSEHLFQQESQRPPWLTLCYRGAATNLLTPCSSLNLKSAEIHPNFFVKSTQTIWGNPFRLFGEIHPQTRGRIQTYGFQVTICSIANAINASIWRQRKWCWLLKKMFQIDHLTSLQFHAFCYWQGWKLWCFQKNARLISKCWLLLVVHYWSDSRKFPIAVSVS